MISLHRQAVHAAIALTLFGTWAAAPAQTAAPKPAAKAASAPSATKAAKAPAKRGKAPLPVKPPELVIAPADPEQVSAAEKVFYGAYDCEFNQSINIAASTEHFAYVDLKLAKSTYLMKPVLSSTGAIRLEDVREETLMVQISSKSMLLNVKTGQRLVDACVSPKQRELIEAARAAKAEAAASAAASGASEPEAAAPLFK